MHDGGGFLWSVVVWLTTVICGERDGMSAVDDLETLGLSSDGKRQWLIQVAYRGTEARKILSIVAGVLALLSAASITAIIAELTSSFGVKLVSAIVAFCSGMITLCVSTYYSESETHKAYDGAAKFMALRDQANLALRRPDISEKQAFTELSGLIKAYNNTSAEYDRIIARYFSVHQRQEFWGFKGFNFPFAPVDRFVEKNKAPAETDVQKS
jgi:hypothetical protein